MRLNNEGQGPSPLTHWMHELFNVIGCQKLLGSGLIWSTKWMDDFPSLFSPLSSSLSYVLAMLRPYVIERQTPVASP